MAARRKARLVPTGMLTTREKLWAAMRELKHFTVPELARAAGVDRHAYNIRDYLLGLVRADILFAEPPASPGCFMVYRLQRDLGVDAPRVRRDGTVPPENAQNRMWRAMKVLRVFSVRDLVVHAALPEAPIAPGAALRYCQWLARGKYLAALPREKNDVARFRFIRDTGAKAPQILRVKQLFDANTGEIVVGQDIQSALDDAEGASC